MEHILQCGDLTAEYDAVVVLEDDIVVAKGFMQYAAAAVENYWDDDLIAGISLYTHGTNQGNGRFFEAQYNGYDVFMMQCSARSLGASAGRGICGKSSGRGMPVIMGN